MDFRTLGLALMISAAAPAQERLIVGVYNLAGVPGSVLEKAKSEAARIYAKGGIATEWVECDADDAGMAPACEGAGLPHRPVLKIMARSADKRQPRDSLGTAVVPEAGRFGTQAWIFFETIGAVAARDGVDAPDVLAVAMAHELGHLLLGQKAHSRRGIMQGAWKKAELQRAASGGLTFTQEQAERMQAQVRGRAASVIAARTR